MKWVMLFIAISVVVGGSRKTEEEFLRRMAAKASAKGEKADRRAAGPVELVQAPEQPASRVPELVVETTNCSFASIAPQMRSVVESAMRAIQSEMESESSIPSVASVM